MDVTVYHYLAETNPQIAQQIINHFGYQIVDQSRLGDSLQEVVASEGEEALKMVMNNHPDRDIIIELTDSKKESCKACEERKLIDKYANASGSEGSQAKSVENNFSVLFLAGITILAVAIIKK